jgi:hypothetical protein
VGRGKLNGERQKQFSKRSQLLSSPGGTSSLPEVIGSLFGLGIGKNGLLALDEEAIPSEEVEQLHGFSSHRNPAASEDIYQSIK